jgi:hypothetical protein
MLDVLGLYCGKWRISVNIEKTVIMVFHRPREVLREEYILMFSGERLQVVDLFKYLGLIFMSQVGMDI